MVKIVWLHIPALEERMYETRDFVLRLNPLNDSITFFSSSVSLKALTTKSNVPKESVSELDFLMFSIENLNFVDNPSIF